MFHIASSTGRGGRERERVFVTGLVLLIAAAFAIQVHQLGAKSLWSDEGLTLRRAEQPLGLIVKNLNLIPTAPAYYTPQNSKPETQNSKPIKLYLPLVCANTGATEQRDVVATSDLHPPLYFLAMHVWIKVAGQSEFALRYPSVMAAVLMLPLLYVLGRAILSAEAGLWAALLAALSPFYLWYAQEARMYTWVAVLSAASVYTLLPLLRGSSRWRDYLAYAAVTLMLLYTHYSGFLLLAFEILLYVVYGLREHPRRTLIIIGILTVPLIPLIPHVWHTQQRELFAFVYRPLPRILAEICSSFSLGPSSSAIRPIWQLLPFLMLAAASIPAFKKKRRCSPPPPNSKLKTQNSSLHPWGIGLGYFLVPILAQYVISLFRPNYMNPRHLMIVSPAWELLMAQGLVTLRRKLWPGLVVMLALTLFLRGQAVHAIFNDHSLWKDDIRGAAAYIEAHARPGDAVVLHHPVIRLTFDYYYDGPYPETTIPPFGIGGDTARTLTMFKQWSERYDRIWFLYGPPPTYFPHDFLPNWADAHLFKTHQRAFEAWWTYVGVAAYDDAPPIFDTLPADVAPRDLSWDGLHLTGFRAHEGVAGRNTWLHLYWQVEGERADEPLALKVQLLDEAGATWYERTSEVLPFYPPSDWPTDRIIQTEVRLPMPHDTPPISYTVQIEPVGIGGAQAVGQVGVNRPDAPPPAPRPQARFEGGLELLSSELRSHEFRAGYPLLGSLTWRAADAINADSPVRLRVRLVDLLGRERAVNEMAISAEGFPISAWRPGDQVASRLVLPLPADLKGGRYRVQVGLMEPGGGNAEMKSVQRWYGKREWVTIDTVRIEAWPMVTRLPKEIDHRLEDVRVAEVVRLRGYDLTLEQTTEGSAEDALRVTLYWEAEQPLDKLYHVFVHLGSPDAPPIAQAGGVPVDWTRPTSTWRAGEIIADTYTIPLTDVPAGQYDLMTGFYDPETGQRPTTLVHGESIPGRYIPLHVVDVEK